MPEPELSRLEHQIGSVLRVGVALSAGALLLGLVLEFAGVPIADTVVRGGLLLLMAIPITRIVTSFIDALRRDDHLLSTATAFVLIVMTLTVIYSWHLKR